MVLYSCPTVHYNCEIRHVNWQTYLEYEDKSELSCGVREESCLLLEALCRIIDDLMNVTDSEDAQRDFAINAIFYIDALLCSVNVQLNRNILCRSKEPASVLLDCLVELLDLSRFAP